MENSTIFVTAFISNINNNVNKGLQAYIDYGKKMLNLNIFQIIFIEKEIFNEYLSEYNSEIRYSFEYYIDGTALKVFEYIIFNNNKIFVFFEKEDNYLYNYKDDISEFNVISDNPKKDTIEYMFIQSHKTEWVKMGIYLMKEREKVENTEFLWVDYGIYHMIRNDDVFETEFTNLEKRSLFNIHNNSIRIASCWDLNLLYHGVNIYKKITWYFAGSIFGGTEDKLIEFAAKTREKCLQIIQEKKSLMWEVNVWYLVYLENRELFNSYRCDHNSSIIMNY
jgi:hypothetical protein